MKPLRNILAKIKSHLVYEEPPKNSEPSENSSEFSEPSEDSSPTSQYFISKEEELEFYLGQWRKEAERADFLFGLFVAIVASTVIWGGLYYFR